MTVRNPDPAGVPSTRHIGGAGAAGEAHRRNKKLKPHGGHPSQGRVPNGSLGLSGSGLSNMAKAAKAHK